MRTLSAIVLVMFAVSVQAQTISSFDVLNIGVGSAAAGLGQCAAAETGSAEGVFYNPATLGSIDGTVSLLGSFNPYMSMALWSGAFIWRITGVVTIAASGYGLLFTDPIIGDILYSGDTGRTLPAGDYVFSGHAALPFGSYLRLPFLFDIGVSVRYVLEQLDDVSISGIMADAGVLVAFTNIADKHSIAFGAYGRNLGVGLGGDITLPAAVTAGVKYHVKLSRTFGLKALFDATVFFNDAPKFDLGTEFDIFNVAFIRAGYMFGYDARGFTIGAGARIAIDTMKFRFDYSFVPLGDLGMHHALELSVMFGDPHAAPVNDGRAHYERGEALFREGRFREAADSYALVPVGSTLYRTAMERLAAAEAMIASQTAAKSDEEIYAEAVSFAQAREYRRAIELWRKIPQSSSLYERAQASIQKANERIIAGE